MFKLIDGTAGSYPTLDRGVTVESLLESKGIHRVHFTPKEWIELVVDAASSFGLPEDVDALRKQLKKIHLPESKTWSPQVHMDKSTTTGDCWLFKLWWRVATRY
jgi:hypothetical protein